MFNEINLFSDTCGGILTALGGIIQSPNYPSAYPDDADCVWEIIGQRNMQFDIQFMSFDLPPKSQRCITYLKIADSIGDYFLNFYGGYEVPVIGERYTFFDNVLKVVFRTSRNEEQHYGFQLRYIAIQDPLASIPSNIGTKVATINAKSK